MGQGKTGEAAAASTPAVATADGAGAPLPGPARASSPAAPIFNRLRGIFLLLVMAALGYGLSLLRDASRPAMVVSALPGPEGRTILVVVEERKSAEAWPFEPEVRLILSRIPIEFDAGRSVVRPHGQAPQVVARSWPTVLVDPGGRLEPGGLRLELHDAEVFRRLGFEEARQRLAALDPALDRFWTR